MSSSTWNAYFLATLAKNRFFSCRIRLHDANAQVRPACQRVINSRALVNFVSKFVLWLSTLHTLQVWSSELQKRDVRFSTLWARKELVLRPKTINGAVTNLEGDPGLQSASAYLFQKSQEETGWLWTTNESEDSEVIRTLTQTVVELKDDPVPDITQQTSGQLPNASQLGSSSFLVRRVGHSYSDVMRIQVQSRIRVVVCLSLESFLEQSRKIIGSERSTYLTGLKELFAGRKLGNLSFIPGLKFDCQMISTCGCFEAISQPNNQTDAKANWIGKSLPF